MPTKICSKRASYQIAEFKAAPDGAPGEFTALVSVFGNVDLIGDRVMPDAFKNSLALWKASGDPIPVIWSHDWDDPFAHIGYLLDAVATAKGLLVHGVIDITKPFAKQVYDLLVARRVKEWSFAYDVFSEARAKDGANDLLDLGLIEVGPTLKGMNPDTDTLAAKALLDAAAHAERYQDMIDDLSSFEQHLKALSGRKVYLDAEIPGSFDEIEETVRTAAQALLNPTDDENVYVWVQATFPDYAIVQVCRDGEDDENYRIPWTADGPDAVTLGEPVAVEVSVSITPKSAKAGRRISTASANELKAIHEALGATHEQLGTFLNGVMTDDEKSNEPGGAPARDADGNKTEADEQHRDDGREPPAKSIDADVLALRTRIEQMRATQ